MIIKIINDNINKSIRFTHMKPISKWGKIS